MYRGTLSLRRLVVLIRHLPRESSLAQALDPTTEWSVTDYLIAMAVDALNDLAWLTVEVNRGKGRQSKRPDPIKRPGEQRSKVRELTPGQPRPPRDVSNLPRLDGDEFAAWLAG